MFNAIQILPDKGRLEELLSSVQDREADSEISKYLKPLVLWTKWTKTKSLVPVKFEDLDQYLQHLTDTENTNQKGVQNVADAISWAHRSLGLELGFEITIFEERVAELKRLIGRFVHILLVYLIVTYMH